MKNNIHHFICGKSLLLTVSEPENECLFLTGSPGTGKTVMLSESLKIKLSKLKYREADVKIFVTTYRNYNTELLEKYRQQYLVNIENINFSNLPQLCRDLNIVFNFGDPQSTLNNLVRALSNKYSDSRVILLCDEVQCYWSSDWSNMDTCHNVVWLMAINPSSNGDDANITIASPTSEHVLSQQLQVKYRNCHQIR